MRISVTLSDEMAKAVQEETNDVPAFVAEAIEEKLARVRQKKAREQILDLAGTGGVHGDVDRALQEERRPGSRLA